MLKKFLTLALAFFLMMPLQAYAQDAQTQQETTSTKIPVVPHRAIYAMKLGSVKNGSNISDVSGKMFFEWRDGCDGWAVQQHLELQIAYSEGDETDIDSTVVTWESKDGKAYNFNVRRVTNGKETENYRGRATLDGNGGNAKYSTPKDKDVHLESDTIFPSMHTELIIQKASENERLFTRKVFDGSDEDGFADVSAFIGNMKDEFQTTEMNPSLKDNPLLDSPGWNIRLAFFKPKAETGEPDYEMNMTLLANGVTKSMQIDYGDFSVTGILEHLEKLPPSGC